MMPIGFGFVAGSPIAYKPQLGTMFTVTCEAIFNTHLSVYRSALVGIGETGHQIPVIIVELLDSRSLTKKRKIEIIDELKSLASKYWQTDSIEHVLIHPALPVDIRHNSKIFREKLRPWAAKELKQT